MTVKIFRMLEPRTFRNERKWQIFVQESYFDFIPRPVKKPIYKLYLKDILYDKYGPDSFLFPEEKLFPVRNINTGQYDCRLIQYALIRALTLKRIGPEFDYIYDKALEFFEKSECKKSVKITLTETGEEVALIDFLEKLKDADGKCEIIKPDDYNQERKPSCHKPKHHGKYKRLKKTHSDMSYKKE